MKNYVSFPYAMGRKRSKHKTIRLPLTVIEPTYVILEKLVETGRYGNGPTEAAKKILMRHLDELEERGKIPFHPELKDDDKA